MARSWEGYRRCLPEQVPPDTAWTNSIFWSETHDVAYGGPAILRRQWDCGAPYRRIKDHRKNTVTYYRLVRGETQREERETNE